MKTQIAILVVAVVTVGAVCFWMAPVPTAPAGKPDSQDNAAAARSSEVEIDVELDPTTQEIIWDAEHITFEIEHRFGAAFQAALRERDRQRLLAFLRDGFAAEVFENDDGDSRSQAGIHETSLHESVNPRRAATAGELAGVLLDAVSEFESVQSTGLRVLNILSEAPGVWSTRLLVTAAGPRRGGGLIEHESTHAATFEFTDKEQLGDEPVLSSWRDESRRVRSTGRLLLEEATSRFGLDKIDLPDNWNLPPRRAAQYRFQLAVEDYDRDGWLDVAIAEHDRSRLLKWRPETGRYEDVADSLGIVIDHRRHRSLGALAGWIDFNNDNWPDLLLGSRLYRNHDGRRFIDVTESSGLAFRPQGMGVLVADYDGDGRLDLYVLYQSDPGRTPPNVKLPWINEDRYGAPNHLWRNVGDGRFRNVTDEANAGGGFRHTLAGTWFHYDDDHYPDLYIANDLSTNVLLRNRGDGTFEDVSQASRTSDFATSMGVVAGDTDNDGASDLYVANMYSKMGRRIIAHVCAEDYPPGIFAQIQGSCAGNRLYRRSHGQMDFDEFGEAFGIDGVGWAYAPAMADLDNDGWLDLYATTGFLSFERGKPDG